MSISPFADQIFCCLSAFQMLTGYPVFLLPTSGKILRERPGKKIILSDPSSLPGNGHHGEKKVDVWIIQCLKLLECQHSTVAERTTSRSSSVGSSLGSAAS